MSGGAQDTIFFNAYKNQYSHGRSYQPLWLLTALHVQWCLSSVVPRLCYHSVQQVCTVMNIVSVSDITTVNTLWLS